MRTTIIFLGVALLTITGSKAANGFENQVLQGVVASNPNDTVVLDGNPGKTIEEIIAEDKLITEYQEESAESLSVNRTMEERIAEDNEIIESVISNERYPLDFVKINRLDDYPKCSNQNAKIPVMLKM